MIDVLVAMHWYAGLFLLAGFILMILEMLHPGFGMFGITGGILLALGVAFTAHTLVEAFNMAMLILAILVVMFIFFLRSFSKGKLNKTIVLQNSQKRDSGYIGTEDFNGFLGKEGITATVLRPSGTADFDGSKIDVVSESEFIPQGIKVKVIKVEGRRIVVREVM
jgi:membrane-bound ClpP family serine protease